MIRFRLISGFILIVLAGMAFMGLQLPTEKEQPLTLAIVLVAALLGGIGQFGLAVVSVMDVASHLFRRLTIGAIVAPLLTITAPFAAAIGSLFRGTISFSDWLSLTVGIVLSIVLWLTIRHLALKRE